MATESLKETYRKSLGIVNLFRTYQQIYRLNQLTGIEIANSYGDIIRHGLGRREDSMLTLVCAKNEEQDLPRLLLALAQSEFPTRVVIVDHNSTDRTAAVATTLGATVISEKAPGICNALARGFEYIQEMGEQRFLLTDADSYPTKTWVGAMQGEVNSPQNSGAEIFGPVFYYGEQGKDNFRSVITLGLDIRAKIVDISRAHGPNAAIILDNQGALIDALCTNMRSDETPERRFNRDFVSDQVVRDIVSLAGGVTYNYLNPRALVFARGDRYPSIGSILKSAVSKKYKKDVIYSGFKT